MREVESIHQFERDSKYRLNKDITVIRCNDSAVYEFERAAGRKTARLVRAFQPSGEMSHLGSNKRLPAAVEETASVLLEGWSK
jgi:hypothetical protein